MQADIFYKTTCSDALPLSFLSKAEFQQQLPGLTPYEREHFAIQQFNGNLGQFAIIRNAKGRPEKIIIGTGDGHQALAMAHAATMIPPGHYYPESQLSEFAQISWGLAQYRFDRYKSADALPRVLLLPKEKLDLLLPEIKAVFLVRDLINTPANDLSPEHLAEVVEKLANEHGGIFKQWVGNELLDDNFPAIHAVGRGSVKEPRLLSLTWGDAAHPKVTLLGKGVTFDTGGLDIKPSSGMRLMKKDMGGAAQVIGLASWLMAIQLPIRLQVLIPAVENSPGGDAYRPGDILYMRNGLSVEIDNTDAEGRLILADALCKACEEKPELLLDFATLTGAARVAVGTEISALFTSDDALAIHLSKKGEEKFDPIWRLPLYGNYSSMLESTVADLVNCSASPYAGAITAALFLQRFVDPGIPWAHFDIMAWNLGSKPGRPEGGEAMAMRAVGSFLLERYGRRGSPIS